MSDSAVPTNITAPSGSLNTSIFFRIRRNHGLEHATLHVLASHFPRKAFAGYSDPGGFWIIGDIPTETLADSVNEALGRLKAGEHDLAIHPNCGTNFLVSGAFAGLAGAAAMLGVGKRRQDKLERLPLVITMATLAVILAQPLGLLVQARVTTSSNPGTPVSVEITRRQQGRLNLHRIQVRG
jgi:hypothetical protein